MCYCASKRWLRHTCDLINCYLILHWMRYRESVWKYVLQLWIMICANYWLLAGMFAIDCVLCRTVSQHFACVLVPCVSNWCEETVTVICPEVTLCGWRDIQIQELNNWNMCNGPVLIWWMKYMSIYWICMGITHCATLWMTAELKQKNPSEGSDVSSSKKQEQQIRQQC